jgi:hypothetical protein
MNNLMEEKKKTHEILLHKHKLITDLKSQMEKLREANSDNVTQMGKTFDGFQARLQDTLGA